MFSQLLSVRTRVGESLRLPADRPIVGESSCHRPCLPLVDGPDLRHSLSSSRSYWIPDPLPLLWRYVAVSGSRWESPFNVRRLNGALVTAAAEVTGRLLFGTGFATQIRPRRYYTLPKETVDRVLDDVHELLNFFVIEFQRILFAENLAYTVAVCPSTGMTRVDRSMDPFRLM